MARGYEFPTPVKDKEKLSREVVGIATNHRFNVDYFPDRMVLKGKETEYIITSWGISEIGKPNPAYEEFKSVIKPLVGVAHG